MYYPRYFELLTRYFSDSPLTTTPVAMLTRFIRPNRLGDHLSIELNEDAGEWTYTGRMDGVDHFEVSSLPFAALSKKTAGFSTGPHEVNAWAAGPDGFMQLSRSFEYLSDAAEMFLEDALDLDFHEMHVGQRVGIPTVKFKTTVNELPRVGEEVLMSVQPVKIGGKSLTLRYQMLRGDQCLIENEQVVVFVAMRPDGFQSIDIPDDMRGLLQERLDVAA